MDDAVDRVLRAIESGELQPEDLTARRIGALLGKTTSVLYHHWGSLDIFLYDVSQAGHRQLGQALEGLSPCEMAEAYVRFAVARPGLYELMFHRRWDWAALRERRDLRASVGFGMWQRLVRRLADAGSTDPDADARALYGGLHGIASLAISGRSNVGRLDRTDLETAIHAARRLVERIVPEAP